MDSHFVFMNPMVQCVLELAVFSLGGMLVMFLITNYLESKNYISERTGYSLGQFGWMLFLVAWFIRWVIYDLHN
jgi:hypothetical protein